MKNIGHAPKHSRLQQQTQRSPGDMDVSMKYAAKEVQATREKREPSRRHRRRRRSRRRQPRTDAKEGAAGDQHHKAGRRITGNLISRGLNPSTFCNRLGLNPSTLCNFSLNRLCFDLDCKCVGHGLELCQNVHVWDSRNILQGR